MSAHTPGPWAWNDAYCGLEGAGEKVLHYTEYEGMWFCCEPSVDANARLIAAAPCLLACLIDLVDGYSMGGAERARAVIAKATGAPA